MSTLVSLLNRLYACGEAREWARSLDHDDLVLAWATCPRGDWMLWFAARVAAPRTAIVAAACACARLALPRWDARYPDDARPMVAIETAERWSRGEATIAEVRAAGDAAWAAARLAAHAAHVYAAYADADADADADAYAAAASADATSHAADATSHAASAAAAADADAYAAAYAYAAANADAADAARTRELARCAVEVRRILTWPMMADALGVHP